MHATSLLSAALLGCVGQDPEPATQALTAAEDDGLVELPSGGLADEARCADVGTDPVIFWLPGTHAEVGEYRVLLAAVAEETGRCVVGLPAFFEVFLSGCCAVSDEYWDPVDGACLAAETDARLLGDPTAFTCTDGTSWESPPDHSVEALVRAAAADLGLVGPDGDVPWERVVLGGHSAGAILSLELAVRDHTIGGLALVGGLVFQVDAPDTWPEWVHGGSRTDLARVRALQHALDDDAERRRGYAEVGIPDGNVRTSEDTSDSCIEWPHSCLVRDDLLPEDDAFRADWAWLFGVEGAR